MTKSDVVEQAPYIAHPPKRADGRRNYESILVAARSAFSRFGTQASLESIASTAGVAIGTLYRHFPTRETLIEALTRESLDGLTELALNASDHTPLEALRLWVEHAVIHASLFRGLTTLLSESYYDVGSPLHQSCLEMHTASERLLHVAQSAGEVRSDANAEELWAIILSAGWIKETSPPSHDQSAVVVRLALDGLTGSLRAKGKLDDGNPRLREINRREE